MTPDNPAPDWIIVVGSNGPTGAVATPLNTQIQLGWNPLAGATSYKVKRSEISGSSNVVVFSGIPTKSYTDTGLINDKTYYYIVTAIVGGVETGPSNQAQGTPFLPPPTTPTGVIATGLHSRVALAWTISNYATAYIVRRATSVSGPFEDVAIPDTNSWTDNFSIINGQTYYYKVCAINPSGVSGYSNVVPATPTAPSGFPALLVVGNTVLDSGDLALSSRLQSLKYTNLTIKKESTAVGSDAVGKALVVISASINPALLNGAFRDVAFPVVVLANGVMDDMKMTGGTLNTDFGVQGAQTSLNIINTTTSLSAGFPVGVRAVSASSSFTWAKPGLTPGTSSISIANLSTGDTTRAGIYAYESGSSMVGIPAPSRRVGFFADSGTAGNLNADGVKLLNAAIRWAAGVPEAPTSVTVRTDPDGVVRLTWDVSTPAYSFNIKRSTISGDPNPTTIATGVTGSGFADTTAQPGQQYYYVVEAANDSGFSNLTAEVALQGVNKPDFQGRPYLKLFSAQSNPQNTATVWNETTYTAEIFTLLGTAIKANSGQWSVSPQFANEFVITKLNDLQCKVSLKSNSVKGVYNLFYAAELADNTPVSGKLPIRIDDRIGIRIVFRFAEVPDATTNQTARKANLFSTTTAVRKAARESVVNPILQNLTIYSPPAVPPNPAPPPVSPASEAWEQACIDFPSPTLDTSLPGSDKYNKFKSTWYSSGKFIAFDADGNFTDYAGTIEAWSKENNALTVYFVKGIEGATPSSNIILGACYKGGMTIYVSDAATDAEVVSVLSHEIGHSLTLRHTNTEFCTPASMLNSALNRALNYAVNHPPPPPASANVHQYNLMCPDQEGTLKTWLTNDQCKRANAAARLAKYFSGTFP